MLTSFRETFPILRPAWELNPLAGWQSRSPVVPQAFSDEDEIATRGWEESITALPLSYLASARAGIEPATNVFFQAFAISRCRRQEVLETFWGPASDRHSTSHGAKAGVEPASSGVIVVSNAFGW